MSFFERWMLRIGFGLALTTGVAYGYLRYFAQARGEFGLEPHAWQGFTQHAHVLAAPAFLFALGAGVRGHVLGMLRHGVRRGRRSGLMVAALSAPMVLGGFAIQVVTSRAARDAVGWTHAGVGVLFALLYLWHWAKAGAAARRARLTRLPSRGPLPQLVGVKPRRPSNAADAQGAQQLS
jgi:hypothetical protein